MDVASYRRKVSEIIKTKSDESKGVAKSDKNLDDAKVGMGFMLLRMALKTAEAGATMVGADLSGLEKNCTDDAILNTAWAAWTREKFGEATMTPAMMICFCLSAQTLYTFNTNRIKAKNQKPETHEEQLARARADVLSQEPPQKKHRQTIEEPITFDDLIRSGALYEEVDSDFESDDEDLLRVHKTVVNRE
jgi:hypothetical protein